MSKTKMSKKNKIVAGAATAALLAVGGGAAYAYWSAPGSGSGTATAASGAVLVLNATFDNGLAPGKTVGVSYTATHQSGAAGVVGTLTPTVTASGSCNAEWFTVSANTYNATVNPGDTGKAVGAGTLKFNNNTDVDQGACKDATITVTVSAS